VPDISNSKTAKQLRAWLLPPAPVTQASPAAAVPTPLQRQEEDVNVVWRRQFEIEEESPRRSWRDDPVWARGVLARMGDPYSPESEHAEWKQVFEEVLAAVYSGDW
jgi:hypothetical protein